MMPTQFLADGDLGLPLNDEFDEVNRNSPVRCCREKKDNSYQHDIQVKKKNPDLLRKVSENFRCSLLVVK